MNTEWQLWGWAHMVPMASNPKNPTYKDVWQTASLYHLVHTAALVAAPITKHPNIFGGLLTTGILAFSGTCYTVALLEDRKYSTLAPFGELVRFKRMSTGHWRSDKLGKNNKVHTRNRAESTVQWR
ncbi:hypothetical protein Prudu_009750 [Prunus dulcis]|uniref:Uncharacterized protein n=1 Tax=Prunus dulcis TaxID=3755 RepID=A0A4Y1R751_PRUDU|nr:hypothetical protein Prudu_009750 [Prunus dulcis]